MNNVTENTKVIYVGIDVHKDTNSFCAYDSREDKLFAEHKSSSKFENTLHYLKNLQKSVGKDAVFLIGYEAGPTGYGLCRKLQKEGFACVIIAPSTIAKAPGQKVKTDRMDARLLAKTLAFKTYSPVCLPSEKLEAIKEYTRVRTVNFADKWLQESFEEYHAEVITLMDKVQRIEAKILELCKDDEVREKIDALVCISGISYVWSYFDCRGNRGFFPFFKGEVLRKLYRTLSRQNQSG
nr:transposase [uncultured Treponema sp.]